MQKTNWIILANKDRGTDYGVGTFIKQLSTGLAKNKQIEVFVLEIGLKNRNCFKIRKQGYVSIFEIPSLDQINKIDTKKNHEKFGRTISRLISQYISKSYSTVIHMNYIFQYFIAKELKKEFNGLVFFTQHLFTNTFQANSKMFDTEEPTYDLVDKIITVTSHGKDHLIKKKVEEDKINVIYNGIDPALFKYNPKNIVKEKYGIDTEEKIVLYSGRIDEIKGLEYLCKAFKILLNKVSGCRLIIAGNGDYESLVKFSKNFSAKISFLGFIPFEDLVDLYHEADIGVIPSLEEHCSYVALEMLHCGLPVVASKLGGLQEIFTHEIDGMLVETVPDKTNQYGIAPNVGLLSDYMEILLCDENKRKKIAKNSVKKAKKMFTHEIMSHNYLELLILKKYDNE